MTGQLLIIPEKTDEERDAVADAWIQKGGEVMRIGKFWIRPDIGQNEVSIYGGLAFASVLAQLLDIELISPNDEMIAYLDQKWIKRTIFVHTLEDTSNISFPRFVKPVMAKQFGAQVYDSLTDLMRATEGLPTETKVLISDIVVIEKEVRCFAHQRKILDAAFYEGSGTVASAISFATAFLDGYTKELPTSFVLDLGYNEEKEWFIIELNATWGSGLNGCKAEKVITAIQSATTKL